ncbi:hypothetical protein RCL1_000818 [Eukaryota sp. TZLM3-RCL]
MPFPRTLFTNIEFPLHTMHHDSLEEVAERINPNDGMSDVVDPFKVALNSDKIGVKFSKMDTNPNDSIILELPQERRGEGWSPAVFYKELQDKMFGMTMSSFSVICGLKFLGVDDQGVPVYRFLFEDEEIM